MTLNTQTADHVRSMLLNNPFAVDYLRRGLLNVSALARELHPLVRKQNPKATVESIAIAIQRLELERTPHFFTQLKTLITQVQLSMRTDITLLRLPKQYASDNNPLGRDILFSSLATDHCTIILDTKNAGIIRTKPLLRVDKLGLITVYDTRSAETHNFRNTPGFIHVFISAVSRAGINIVDVFTGEDSVTLVLRREDLLGAFALCEAVKEQEWF